MYYLIEFQFVLLFRKDKRLQLGEEVGADGLAIAHEAFGIHVGLAENLVHGGHILPYLVGKPLGVNTLPLQ